MQDGDASLEAIISDNGAGGASILHALCAHFSVAPTSPPSPYLLNQWHALRHCTSTAAAQGVHPALQRLCLRLRSCGLRCVLSILANTPHRAGASGFVRVTVAAAGCDEVCFTEYELDVVTGVPQRTGETAEQPKSLAACGVTLRLAVPGEQSAVEAAARQLSSYMRRYHWLPGNPLKLTLTLPDGSTFTAAPALATAAAASATAAGQTASAFTFDDVALSPGVVARAAADCLQQPIRPHRFIATVGLLVLSVLVLCTASLQVPDAAVCDEEYSSTVGLQCTLSRRSHHHDDATCTCVLAAQAAMVLVREATATTATTAPATTVTSSGSTTTGEGVSCLLISTLRDCFARHSSVCETFDTHRFLYTLLCSTETSLLARAVVAMQWKDQLGVDILRKPAISNPSSGSSSSSSSSAATSLYLSAAAGTGLLEGLAAVHIVCNAKPAVQSDDAATGAAAAVPYGVLYDAATAPTGSLIDRASDYSLSSEQDSALTTAALVLHTERLNNFVHLHMMQVHSCCC
eukprot:12473-Heterococcus_DN1.PRE.6